MKTRSLAVASVLPVVSVLLAACPGGGGGTPTVTLKGDVACPVPPPSVTGSATSDFATQHTHLEQCTVPGG